MSNEHNYKNMYNYDVIIMFSTKLNQIKIQNRRFGKFNLAIWIILYDVIQNALEVFSYKNYERSCNFVDIG